MNQNLFIYLAVFVILTGCSNSPFKSEVSAQAVTKSYQSTQESIQWIRPVLERKPLFGSKVQAAFEAIYRSRNKEEISKVLKSIFTTLSKDQISDLMKILTFDWPQMAKRDPDEKDHEWLASELLMTKRWDLKSERDAAALLWPSIDSPDLSLDQIIGIRALEAIQLMKNSVPQIKNDDDRAIIARNWSDGKAFVWSTSSLGSKPEWLAPFLQAGFDRVDEATVMTLHHFSVDATQVKISESISLLRADWISIPLSFYEADKSKLNIEREKLSTPFQDVVESVGFAVLKSAQGECSIPFVGQSNQGEMIWILGAEASPQDQALAPSGRFNLNGVNTAIAVLSDLEKSCHWQTTQNSDWRAKPELSENFVGNYSVFRFQGALLKDPFLRSSKSVALVAQRPNIRRGLDYACALPEEKNWLLVGSEQNGVFQMSGGRMAIERDEQNQGLRVFPVAGARFVLNSKSLRDSFISVYVPGRVQEARTLRFDEIPKNLAKDPQFYMWLARQIKNDPY